MPTSLGGLKSVGVRLMVKNSSAAIIPRGYCVSWSSIASGNPLVSFLDGTDNKDYGTGTKRQTEIPYISVILSVVDGTVPGGSSRLGIVTADIPAGGFGEVVAFGLAQVYFPASAAITAGEVITVTAAGVGLDAANASHDNPIGIVMETVDTTAGLRWCFINCLNPAGASSTGFMGKGY